MQKTILAMAVVMAFAESAAAASFGSITIDGHEVLDSSALNGGG